MGHSGLILRLGRSFGEGNGNPLQYSRLENSTTLRMLIVRWRTHVRKLQRKSSMVEAMMEGLIGCWGVIEQGSSNPDWRGKKKEVFLTDPCPRHKNK